MSGARWRAASKVVQLGIVAGVLIVATSCSGGDGAPAVSPQESPVSAESTSDSPFALYLEGPIPEAAAVIHREHGDVDGFAVTVVALDSGYSVSQIIANPSIGADGQIAGLDPDGVPLGLVESDGGPQGLRTTPSTTPLPPKRPTDRVLLLFDLTMDDVHEEANNRLQAQLERDFDEWKGDAQAERAAAESQAEEVRLAAVVLVLIAQGYTLVEAMQGIFFGEYEVSGGAACARLSMPPTGPKLTAAAFDCELGFPETSTTQAADAQTEPAPDPVAASPDEGGVFVGAFDGFEDFGEFGIESNQAELIVSDGVVQFNGLIRVRTNCEGAFKDFIVTAGPSSSEADAAIPAEWLVDFVNTDLCPEKTVEGDGQVFEATAVVTLSGDQAVVEFDVDGGIFTATMTREGAAAD